MIYAADGKESTVTNRISMILGEIRRVTVRVTYRGQETDFNITSPEYKLIDSAGLVEDGTPVVTGNDMTCLISPPAEGQYMLEFKFGIGDEVWVQRVSVTVRK